MAISLAGFVTLASVSSLVSLASRSAASGAGMTFGVFRVWCGCSTPEASFALGALGVGARVNNGNRARTALGSLSLLSSL
jgi:hypothetical protein